jgi:hypothetical protein
MNEKKSHMEVRLGLVHLDGIPDGVLDVYAPLEHVVRVHVQNENGTGFVHWNSSETDTFVKSFYYLSFCNYELEKISVYSMMQIK